MEGKKGTVCVTGGAGYIGSWLIMRLLQRGYSVTTTVRLNPESKKDLSHLTNLPGASERLKIFNADLNRPETFLPPIEGCNGVFHTAHPIDIEGIEADDATINMAVQGTLGLTILDENTWTDVDFCRTAKVLGSSYCIPKTLAEQGALKFAQETGLEVVTIVPSLVVGPFICPHFPFSNYLALSIITGNREGYKYLPRPQMVHIDDVVSGHIYLLECPDVKGRYICSAIHTTFLQLVKFLSARYPEFRLPPLDLTKEMEEVKPLELSSKKLLDSGFNFKYGIEEMFDGAIKSSKEKRFL
ncbi:Vestitone reductase [Thalictrum thalictroides]|uniref:Vestitone reductase n=1 Tax=Thalictrum thalictroides TaxID=46969 RepID=A0A7J6VZ54_THATH|nr:Vestitone reductase [Thalictrum thalictroides]